MGTGTPNGDLDGSCADVNGEEVVVVLLCCCWPKAEGVPEENAANPPLPLPEPNAPPLALPNVVVPIANALNPLLPPVFMLAGTLTAGFAPNPLCPNPDCPKDGLPNDDCPNDDCPNAEEGFWSVPVAVFVFALAEGLEEPWRLLNAPNPAAGFTRPPPPPNVEVVGAAGGENEPKILGFCSCESVVPVPESLSPRLSDRPPNDVSSPIEASLDISCVVGEGEVVGEGLEPNPKPVFPNGLLLVDGEKEPNAPEGLPNGLDVVEEVNALEEPPNALVAPDPKAPVVLDEPNALDVEALPNDENALKADVEVDVGCPKGIGWDDWPNELNADGEDVCPKVGVCPNPVVPKPLLFPLPNPGCPNAEVVTG